MSTEEPEASLRNYIEVRDYFDREHRDWLRIMTPRHINAPPDYHPQKIFAVASLNALLQNRDAVFDHQRPNAATAMAQVQAAIALRFNNPTFYVSREILNAALRTDLPSDLIFEDIPFPFPAIIFVLPTGSVRHETEGDVPYICISRFFGNEIVPLPIPGYDFPLRIENPSVSVTTYMHQSPVSVAYYKNVTPIPGKTIQECLIQAGSEPFSFTILNEELDENMDGLDLSSEDFIERVWLLGLTLVLIMISGEELVEREKFLKRTSAKNSGNRPLEFWSPNFLGRTYNSQVQRSRDGSGSGVRPHWKRGHIKTQRYGKGLSLVKTIWIRPYRTGKS
jgi:hypothetical protein